ncbi:MAG: hypothetical protein DBX55_09030 [Verrucomicrobia bacterium]|nr:MAG: hypothetical protein DBX55_09030 [Verrucomicrobiota bacterium]
MADVPKLCMRAQKVRPAAQRIRRKKNATLPFAHSNAPILPKKTRSPLRAKQQARRRAGRMRKYRRANGLARRHN